MTDFPITIFHNPACGTSRNVVAMVQAAGYAPTVVEYLQAGWTREQLLDLAARAELAGATTVGTGSGNGSGDGASCDMVRRLQAALRRNPRVRSALASAHGEAAASGKAVLIWNGKWLQSPNQVGRGLAGVREAIIMEVGFAPAACRADPMRGLVVVSLADGPGAPRLALGDASWRWSDLLFAPGTRPPSRG